jgi:hypothetical protein
MAKCRVTKGGWWWKGAEQLVGAVIEEAAEWISHRVRDGLVELLEGEPETASRPAPEKAIAQGRKRK